jgi:predicted Rossmann fold nucleotide-binding protein DprA/Smf involved in DNA uptake
MTQEAAKQRIALLKRLREAHQETVAQAQARLKEQKAIRRQICQVIRDAPKTVPEVAEAAGLPPGQVLWHLIAMKKYDLAVETGMCGEYYLYQLAEEKKK